MIYQHTLPLLRDSTHIATPLPIQLNLLQIRPRQSFSPQSQTQPQRKRHMHTPTPNTDVDIHIRELQNLQYRRFQRPGQNQVSNYSRT